LSKIAKKLKRKYDDYSMPFRSLLRPSVALHCPSAASRVGGREGGGRRRWAKEGT